MKRNSKQTYIADTAKSAAENKNFIFPLTGLTCSLYETSLTCSKISSLWLSVEPLFKHFTSPHYKSTVFFSKNKIRYLVDYTIKYTLSQWKKCIFCNSKNWIMCYYETGKIHLRNTDKIGQKSDIQSYFFRKSTVKIQRSIGLIGSFKQIIKRHLKIIRKCNQGLIIRLSNAVFISADTVLSHIKIECEL